MAAKKRRKAKKSRKVKSRKVKSRSTHKRPTKRRAKAERRARRRAKNTKKGYYPNPVRKHRRRSHRRSNPILGGITRKIPGLGMVVPAATGVAGAVALDVAWAYLPLPANLKTGNMAFVTKAVGALALTWGLGKVVKKSTAEAAGVGMLTIIGYQWVRGVIASMVPGLKMGEVGEMGYYSPGPVSGLEAYDQPMLAAYDQPMAAYMNEFVSEYDQSGGKF